MPIGRTWLEHTWSTVVNTRRIRYLNLQEGA